MREWQFVKGVIPIVVTVATTLVFVCPGFCGDEGERKQPGQSSVDSFAGKTVKNRKHGISLLQAREKNLPRTGTVAPDFALQTADGKKTVKLSSFRGKRPVVLIFGSFT